MRLFSALVGLSLSACTCGDQMVMRARPAIEVEPASVDFGSTAPGVAVRRSTTVRNAGQGTLRFSRVEVSGVDASQFRLDGAPPETLAAGVEAALSLIYEPRATGPHSGRLVFESDAANTAELVVPLSGIARSTDRCEGVRCLSAPSSCFREAGTCTDGACVYTPKDDGVACDDANPCTTDDRCSAGACRGSPLACDAPPAAACVDALSVRVPVSPGQCVSGVCQYTFDTRACASGCDAGTCQGDPCAGVMCPTRPCFEPGRCVLGVCQAQPDIGASCSDNDACTENDSCGASGTCVGTSRACASPPAPTCLDATTQRTSAAVGRCVLPAGTCEYSTSDVTCALGCDQGTGRCRTNCPAGQHQCGTTCVSDSSVATCGQSCTPCPVPVDGVATCTNGTCGFTCTPPAMASGSSCTTWLQKAMLKASNAGAGDQFGWFTAISADGNVIVVAADKEDSSARGVNGNESNDAATDSGAAYVFRRTNGVWAQEAYLKSTISEAGDRLSGVAISADGTAIVISTWGESSSGTGVNVAQPNNAAPDSGAAFLFRRTGAVWQQEAWFKASNTETDDRFATGLAINADGTVLALGARNEDSAATGIGGSQASNAALDSGAVYVFRKTNSTWAHEAYLKQSNTGAGDQFGLRVDLSDDGAVLVVGAWAEDSNGVGVNGVQTNNLMADSGAVYVFRRTASVWAQEAYLKASNTNAGDWFGMAISLSADGRSLAVGARNEASSARGVGANQLDNSAPGAGAVYLFRHTGAAWAQEVFIKAPNADAGDYFGWTVGLSATGDVLAVGAYRESSGSRVVNGDLSSNTSSMSGAAYIFRRTATVWRHDSFLKAANADPGDLFGWNLSLSDDGRTVAVGAIDEDSGSASAPAGNGVPTSGAVYVF